MASMRTSLFSMLVLLPMLVSPGCVRPAEDRAELDRTVGKAAGDGVDFRVVDGLAAIRRLDGGELDLWAQAPALDIVAQADANARQRWTMTVENVMPRAEITAADPTNANFKVVSREQTHPTKITWTLDLEPGQTTRLRVAPPDADTNEAFRFAVLSDIQDDVSEVGDIYRRINQDPTLRYVVSAGDITQYGTMHELVFFQKKLDELDIPFYTTTGNHEIGPADPEGFHNLYGRANFQFRFKGVYFTFVDSANATVDPLVYDWLGGWLDDARDSTNVFVTHIPPIDPSGIRNGAFRSRNEAAKLLAMLARAHVDVGLYGHIHSYYAQSNATIPIYISGGGGALPERFDGIPRHYLTANYEPGEGITDIGLVRIRRDERNK